MQKLYFEAEAEKTNNVKIIDRSGATKPKTEGGLTIDEIRYGFKFKLPENNMPNFYWIYIRGNKIYVTMGSNKIANPNETQKILNFLLNDTNNKITYPLAKDKVTGKLVLVIKEAEKYKNLLSTLRTLVKSNQAIIDTETFNKNQTTTATPGQTENKEQTANTEQKPNEQTQAQASPKTDTNKPLEIANKLLANLKAKNMMANVDASKINFNDIKGDQNVNSLYVKYMTLLVSKLQENKNLMPDQVLMDTEIKAITDQIKIVNKANSKKGLPSKNLINKYGDMFKDLPNIEQSVIDGIKKNINVYFEDEIDFYKEIKNTDLFLEKYLKG
jgi:hypothetical protein